MSFADFLNQNKEKEPGFFDIPILKKAGTGILNFLKNPVQNTVSGIKTGTTAFLDFANNSALAQRNQARTASQDSFVGKTGAQIVNAADTIGTFGKFLAQETGAGVLSIGRSIQQGLTGNSAYGQPSKFDESIFGRPVQSIQEGYIKPVEQYADQQGSGSFEKYLLGTVAGVGGFALESPLGPPAKKPAKTLIKTWITKGASKGEITAGLKGLELSADATRELSDGVRMILESPMKQGEKSTRIQNLIEFVQTQERSIPARQPVNSVLQVVDTKTGRNVFYTVSPEDLRILSEDLIDGTTRGIAGKEIDGKIYHLTAKTPKQMLETAGWSNGGTKTLQDVIEMIQPAQKRVPIRGEGGRFIGSFMMDESSAYKLASDEITAERELAAQIKRFSNADDFVGEVNSIARKVAQYQADPAALRKNVSRIEERLLNTVRKVGDLPRTLDARKAGTPDNDVLKGIYNRLTSDRYTPPSLRSLAVEKQFNEVTKSLEDVFGHRIPIVEMKPAVRGGREVLGRTNGSVIELLRKGNSLDAVVANHEGWHWFKRNLSDAKRKELDELELFYAKAEPERMAALRETYPQGSMSDGAYEKMLREELMADEFANYYTTGRTKWQRVADFFKDAVTSLRTVFGFRTPILDRVGREFRQVRKTLRENRGKSRGKTAHKLGDESEGMQIARMSLEAEMDNLESGLMKTTEDTYLRYSSFPSWIPEGFREKDLIMRVMAHFKKGTEPKPNAVREIALKKHFDEVLQERAKMYETDEDVLNRLAQEAEEDFNVQAQNALPSPDEMGSLQKIAEQQGLPLPEEKSLKSLTSPTVYDTDAKNAVVTTAINQNEPIKDTVRRLEGIRRVKAMILEYAQNTDETIRLIMQDPAVKVTDASNIYQKATLYHGKVDALVQNARKEGEDVIEKIRDNAKYQGTKYDTLKKEVNEYLVALHAPERNAIHGEGAAGMTDAQAKAIVDRVENSPYGEDVKRIAKQIQDLNAKTLDTLLEGGVISEELHATLRDTYKNHVPLYRVLENEEDFGSALAGKGFDVRSSGIKRAKGSDMEVDDILGNVIFNYEQAILRSEKNIVDNATLQFVRDNKEALNGLMKEVELPIVPVAKIQHKGQFSPEIHAVVKKLIDKYGGTYKRELKTGGVFGRATYGPNGTEVLTRFGTSTDTLVHEFGHLLDKHFGLGDSDFFDNATSVELRKVADLRDGLDPNNLSRTPSRQNYVRKKEEKIAEFISMYFTDFDNAMRVAPITTKKMTAFLEKNPELKELSTAMKSRVRAEEVIDEIVFARQQFTSDPSILTMRENGVSKYIKMEDPNLAVAIRGVGREKIGVLMNIIGSFTRFYSGLNTRFNPDFALPNKIRDLQETVTYLAAQPDMKAGGVLKTLRKDPASTKHVLDYLRGKDTEGARLYKEMKEAGGTTGGMGLSTRKQVELDIKKMESIANSKTKRTVQQTIEYIDYWNTIFEDSTRLSVYKAAREQGASIDRAAFLAKEASINFNRMGKGGPLINSLYMFSNASIQGSTKMIRALRNPKVAAGVAAVVGTAVATTSEWNDQVDPEWREKTPKWDRLNSLVVVLPSTDTEYDDKGFVKNTGDFKYVVLPVSWGLKPIKVMADHAYDAVSGHAGDAKNIVEDVLTSIIEGYNPIGGTDLNSALMPTVLDVPYEIDRNKSWSGSKITPTNYNNAPDDSLYFSSLPDTQTGRTAISISEMLAKGGVEVSPARMKYAFEQYVGGTGRFISKVFNVGAGAVNEEPVPLDEYPFLGRFYRERTPEEQSFTKSSSPEAALFEDLSKEDARAKQKTRVLVDQSVREIMSLPTDEEKRAKLKEIAGTDQELAKKIMEKINEEKAGLTPDESQLKNATVAVRAEFVYQRLQKMSSDEEKRAYLKELADKKILTSSVLKALSELQNGNNL